MNILTVILCTAIILHLCMTVGVELLRQGRMIRFATLVILCSWAVSFMIVELL